MLHITSEFLDKGGIIIMGGGSFITIVGKSLTAEWLD